MSLSKPMPKFRLYLLISAAQAKATNASVTNALLCKLGTLDPRKVEGKIVACLLGETARVDKGLACLQAGVAGMILCNDYADRNSLSADVHYLPAIQVAYEDGVEIFDYIKSTERTRPAPLMASFSSVGPNTITPEILKEPLHDNVWHIYVLPHVPGVVGLLKTLHPDWSPAVIRSSIMTSARTRDNSFHPMEDSSHFEATPFEYGARHIQPNHAMDPGFVYDLTFRTYVAHVRQPSTVSISIEPMTLKFEKIGEEMSFQVTLKSKAVGEPRGYAFGSLTWSDGHHYARSPIVVAAAT
ncbi:hypothetical protein Ancab_011947 [Ancistrocladus abbreviatus]